MTLVLERDASFRDPRKQGVTKIVDMDVLDLARWQSGIVGEFYFTAAAHCSRIFEIVDGHMTAIGTHEASTRKLSTHAGDH